MPGLATLKPCNHKHLMIQIKFYLCNEWFCGRTKREISRHREQEKPALRAENCEKCTLFSGAFMPQAVSGPLFLL